MEKLKLIMKEYVVLIILLFFFTIACFISPNFLTILNITNVLRQISMVIIVGCAVNMVMVSKGLDLSVGSIVALSGITLAKLTSGGSDFPFVLAIIIAILVGVICGVINGFIIVKLGVSHIIATLGTMYVFRGIVFIICGSHTIGSGFPSNYDLIGQGYLWKIPIPVIIMLSIFFIFLFIEKRTLLGKYSYVIGGNEQAALLSGVPVKKIKYSLMVISGFMCGIAGVIMTSRSMSAGPLNASGMEFDVILAVLLGGTLLEGGEGSVRGMIFGALILGVIRNAMNLMGLEHTYKYVATGSIFILAIILNKLIKGEKLGGR